jgi:hypothetical protein
VRSAGPRENVRYCYSIKKEIRDAKNHAAYNFLLSLRLRDLRPSFSGKVAVQRRQFRPRIYSANEIVNCAKTARSKPIYSSFSGSSAMLLSPAALRSL